MLYIIYNMKEREGKGRKGKGRERKGTRKSMIETQKEIKKLKS